MYNLQVEMIDTVFDFMKHSIFILSFRIQEYQNRDRF
jgi:hypothetical protein